ncbi:unnamed protein product [Urochloa decumbens]|uniref:At1g61320/AtMIF1 LRR domain-containing protein n=1 Tax=Urochloa decumbens TaxID=240449 RepID=A0ABC9A7P4_9POAL
MSMERQPDCRRRRTQGTNGLNASRAKRKGSPCQRDDDSQGGEIQIQSLPEDTWCYIHSLMPMQAAARAACVSRAFLRSWRCHPNLTFSYTTLGLDKKTCESDAAARDFSGKVDQILKRHSGIGMKKLKIHMFEYCDAKDSCNLDTWLQIAVMPGIEELKLTLPIEADRDSLLGKRAKYIFPHSLLSNGSGDSIRYLFLSGCSFNATAELCWLRSLTKLCLHGVYITGDKLGCLLCNSLALERLEIRYCDGLVCLKVPFMLQQLRYLEVFGCAGLRMIDSKAPNISRFSYEGGRTVQLSLGETLQMKKLYIYFHGAVHYARVELPSSMPNLKTATIYSSCEMINTPMLRSKYLHLKKLSIVLSATTFPAAYDYFSLVSFFDACPSLETLVLNVSQWKMEHASIFTNPLDLRTMQGQQHHKMKRVKILGFTSAKSLVELTCHIVESITSLEHLTLEAIQSSFRCSVPAHKRRKCSPLPTDVLMEAQRAVLAIRTYIEPKVPSMVKLRVVEPCRRCHAVEL